MGFLETVRRAKTYLEEQGRVSLRALRREFELDDEALDELIEELVDVQQVAARTGKVLSWTGTVSAPPPVAETEPAAMGAVPSAAAPAATAAEAGRRQLTVLFCDLVDSTPLASRLDAEDWRDLVRAYQETCESVVRRVDGHVAQYLGDGVLVYFGYPRAHEDDATRAVLAGLEIPRALAPLSELAERDHGAPLMVRIGIHTGPVVVGEMGGGERRETLAMGDTTNVAARLQSLAEPNAVVLSETTIRLVQGLFVTQDLGSHVLKGIADPVPAHRVLRRSGVRSRLDEFSAGGLKPLVGRERELGLLLDRWEQVVEGTGQVVVVSGEAGIGKSRLLQGLRSALSDVPHTWLEFRSSPYTQDSALYPVIELLDQTLAFSDEDSADERVHRLERGLGQAGFDLSETVPLVANLLSLPLPEGYSPPPGTPERTRRRTLHVLLEWLLRLSRSQPLVMIAEDMHWSDPSSLELLGLLFEQVPTSPTLVLATHRPGFEASWPSRSHVTPVALGRLTRRQGQELIENTAGDRELPESLVRQILDRTDGVPLFLEELTKSVLESGALEKGSEAVALLAVPETLQDSLMARLDRLSSVREVAQLCATLGREFPYTLLQAVSPLEEGELQQGLALLVDAEILYQRGLPPDANYTFKHALVQETAYESLLRARRQQFHQKIATALVERFPRIVETQPEWIARHATGAGLTQLAVEHWQRAGQRAIERSANVEAIRHLTCGLEELARLPEGPARSGQELGLLTQRGVALLATEGFSSEPVKLNFARAREICDALGSSAALLPVIYGLYLFHLVRSDCKETRELADELLRVAEGSGDAGARAVAHSAQSALALFGGQFSLAREHATATLEDYDPQLHTGLAYVYSQDPAVYAHALASHALWFQGFPEQALAARDRSLECAEAAGHQFTEAAALVFAGILHGYLREPEKAREYGGRALALSADQGFPIWLAGAIAAEAYAMRFREGAETAHARFQEAIANLDSVGTIAFRPLILCLMAEDRVAAGRPDEAGRLLEAIGELGDILDRGFAAEVERQRGEVTLLRSATAGPEAERFFQRALAIAREQGAAMLELRAATSLARLRQQQGNRAGARDLLQPVYDWFTEGFDTRDLKDAKALLEELG